MREVEIDGDRVTICFDKAYVHSSDGVPGVDAGTGWEQAINIVLDEASVAKCPDDLPNDIDTGYVIIGGKKSENMLELPSRISGEIEVALYTQYGKKLLVKGKKLVTQELGKPQYVEEFPGDEKGLLIDIGHFS